MKPTLDKYLSKNNIEQLPADNFVVKVDEFFKTYNDMRD
jgi:hypothetical protein